MWHELPTGVQDFDALGDALVDIASVESVYDIFTDWDDRRTGRRHVNMLWAGPPRPPLPLCKGSDAATVNSDKLSVPTNSGSMSCHSSSGVSQFDGEIEMVGFDDDTNVEAAANDSSSGEDRKSTVLVSSGEGDSQQGSGQKKGPVNLSIGNVNAPLNSVHTFS